MRKKREPVLPDVLRPGLSLVFCGTAAGRVSAERGHYYAHPQNKFWRTLHEVGLTPRILTPGEYASLLEYNIGLTDIAKHVFGMDKQLPPQSLGRKATEGLREKIEQHGPEILAFTSLTGGRRVLGPRAGFGRQRETIGDTELWILPSPSPAAHWNWNIAIWRELADRVHDSSAFPPPRAGEEDPL